MARLQLLARVVDGNHLPHSRLVISEPLDIRVGHALEPVVEFDFACNRDTVPIVVLVRQPRLVETGDHQRSRGVNQGYLDQAQVATTRALRLDLVDGSRDSARLPDGRAYDGRNARQVDIAERILANEVAHRMDATRRQDPLPGGTHLLHRRDRPVKGQCCLEPVDHGRCGLLHRKHDGIQRLLAALGIDLQVLILFLDTRDQGFESFIVHVLASEDHQVVRILGLHLLQNVQRHILDAAADGFDGIVDEADGIARRDGVAVRVLGVLDGLGNLAGMHLGEGCPWRP